MIFEAKRLKFCVSRPVTNGIGAPAEHDDPEWPRYVRITDILDARTLRNDTFRSLPPEIAQDALFTVGDILAAAVGATFGKSYLHTVDIGPAAFAGYLVRISPSHEFDPRFIAYWSESHHYWNQVNGNVIQATIQNFSAAKFSDLSLPAPTKELQVAISNYLDRETARIDGLIAEKERMLALLEEKRAALISRIVTRGLDPNAPLKPSRQEWLGEIPEHWEEPRAKGLFREVDRRTETGEETLLSLRMGKGLVPHNEVSEKLLEASDVTGFKKVEQGQMVINRMRAASGLIAVATEPGLVSPDYAVFDVVDQELSIEYFLELFKTSLLQAVFRSSSKGLGTGEQGFLRLYTDAFLSLHFPYPPVCAQLAIAKFIEQQRSEMQQMESLLRQSIGLAKERRAALITAAVTGQIPPQAMRA